MLVRRVKRLLAGAFLYRLRTLDVQIDDDWILSAPDNHGFTRHIGAGVDLLMRDVWRNVDKVSRICLIAELQMIAPPHPGTASHNVDHRLQLAMMMRTSLGVRLDHDGTSP